MRQQDIMNITKLTSFNVEIAAHAEETIKERITLDEAIYLIEGLNKLKIPAYIWTSTECISTLIATNTEYVKARQKERKAAKEID